MRIAVLASVLSLSLVGLCTAQEARAVIRKPTSIPAESLDEALRALAKDRQFQVLYRAELVRDVRTKGASGSLTSDEALTQVLSGTGLTYKYLDAQTVTLIPLALGSAASATDQTSTNPQDGAQGGGKNSSQDFLVAQVDQTSAGPQVGTSDATSEKKSTLEEVVVTGSRIPTNAKDTAQEVQVFDSKTITLSGQTTVADFLSTLPAASLSVGEGGTQTIFGSTTVQLRGLPQGTTLVLIDGQRIETSGQQRYNNFFDLNNLPLAVVDHIEVVPDGSSAIYGSDAIAGVVNIVLKKNIEGFEINAGYGGASGIDERDLSASWGHVFDRGGVSVIATYENRGSLLISEREVADEAPGNQYPVCNPGNVFAVAGNLPGLSASYAAVPRGFSGAPTIQEFAGVRGDSITV